MRGFKTRGPESAAIPRLQRATTAATLTQIRARWRIPDAVRVYNATIDLITF